MKRKQILFLVNKNCRILCEISTRSANCENSQCLKTCEILHKCSVHLCHLVIIKVEPTIWVSSCDVIHSPKCVQCENHCECKLILSQCIVVASSDCQMVKANITMLFSMHAQKPCQAVRIRVEQKRSCCQQTAAPRHASVLPQAHTACPQMRTKGQGILVGVMSAQFLLSVAE